MAIEPAEPVLVERPSPREAIGLSLGDAQLIKQTLLQAAKDGVISVGEVFLAAEDIAAAFRLIDAEAADRAEAERAARVAAAQLTPDSK